MLVWWFIGRYLWRVSTHSVAFYFFTSPFPLLLVSWVKGRLGEEAVDTSLWFCFYSYLRWHSPCTTVFLPSQKSICLSFSETLFLFLSVIPNLLIHYINFSFLQTYFLSWQTKKALRLHPKPKQKHPPFFFFDTNSYFVHRLAWNCVWSSCFSLPGAGVQAWASIQFRTIWTLDSHLLIFFFFLYKLPYFCSSLCYWNLLKYILYFSGSQSFFNCFSKIILKIQ